MLHVPASPSRLVGAGARPTSRHRDGQSSDHRRGAIAGLLTKHEAGPGVLVVADGSDRPPTSIFRDAAGTVLEFDLNGLVHAAVAAFRHHPHVNNVITHICGGQWERIRQAFCVILNPLASLDDLSPVAQNIVELMCAERGITGRILKPYFHALLAEVLPPRTAAGLGTHVWRLFLEMQSREANPGKDMAEASDRGR